eukprot:2719899-Prymnesium_polylepis.1
MSSVKDLQACTHATALPRGSRSAVAKSATTYSMRAASHGATSTAAASTAAKDAGFVRSMSTTWAKRRGSRRPTSTPSNPWPAATSTKVWQLPEQRRLPRACAKSSQLSKNSLRSTARRAVSAREKRSAKPPPDHSISRGALPGSRRALLDTPTAVAAALSFSEGHALNGASPFCVGAKGSS